MDFFRDDHRLTSGVRKRGSGSLSSGRRPTPVTSGRLGSRGRYAVAARFGGGWRLGAAQKADCSTRLSWIKSAIGFDFWGIFGDRQGVDCFPKIASAVWWRTSWEAGYWHGKRFGLVALRWTGSARVGGIQRRRWDRRLLRPTSPRLVTRPD